MRWSDYTAELDRREAEFLKPLEENQEKKKKRASIAERVRRKFDPSPKPDERVFSGPAALGRITHCCQCGAVKRDGAKWLEAVSMPDLLIIQWFGSTGLEDIRRPLCGEICVQKEVARWVSMQSLK